jgi:hypothetical protein
MSQPLFPNFFDNDEKYTFNKSEKSYHMGVEGDIDVENWE